MQNLESYPYDAQFDTVINSRNACGTGTTSDQTEFGGFKIIKSILSLLSSIETETVDRSTAWKKIQKSVEALSLLSTPTQRSPVLSLYEMLKDNISGLQPIPTTVRSFQNGTVHRHAIDVFAFSSFETLVLYISSRSSVEAEFFVDLNGLLVGYSQGRSRKLIETQHLREKRYFFADVPFSDVLSDNILAFDILPIELLEVRFHYPILRSVQRGQ